jgi:hypothetical protein
MKFCFFVPCVFCITIIVIIYSLYKYGEYSESVFTGVLWLYPVLNLLVWVNFFICDGLFCLTDRLRFDCLSYLKDKRRPGNGPLRINTKVDTREDIYSLVVSAYFKESLSKHQQDDYKEIRSKHLGEMVCCWLAQMFFCFCLVSEHFCHESVLESLSKLPNNEMLVIARFLAGLLAHKFLLREVEKALATMKFINNHSYRFENSMMAYVTGVLQLIMVMTVEILIVIKILSMHSIEEVVLDFLAIGAIAEFDDKYYEY